MVSTVMLPSMWRLDGSAAAVLRDVIAHLQRPLHGVPMRDLVRVASSARSCAVTLDFQSSRIIGAPVIIVCPVAADACALAKLSPREREVARLLLFGRTNSEIAADLGISVGTVKDHIHHALQKTGVSSRTALAAIVAGTRL